MSGVAAVCARACERARLSPCAREGAVRRAIGPPFYMCKLSEGASLSSDNSNIEPASKQKEFKRKL